MDIHKHITNKMKKTLVLLNNPDVNNHIPVTDWYTDKKAKEMIDCFSSLFIKPNRGKTGIGIIRLKR